MTNSIYILNFKVFISTREISS